MCREKKKKEKKYRQKVRLQRNSPKQERQRGGTSFRKLFCFVRGGFRLGSSLSEPCTFLHRANQDLAAAIHVLFTDVRTEKNKLTAA